MLKHAGSTPHRSNCLLWALAKRHVNGGGVTWRWSVSGWWPHWIWIAPEGHRLSYSPISRYRIPWNILWFRGRVIPER